MAGKKRKEMNKREMEGLRKIMVLSGKNKNKKKRGRKKRILSDDDILQKKHIHAEAERKRHLTIITMIKRLISMTPIAHEGSMRSNFQCAVRYVNYLQSITNALRNPSPELTEMLNSLRASNDHPTEDRIIEETLTEDISESDSFPDTSGYVEDFLNAFETNSRNSHNVLKCFSSRREDEEEFVTGNIRNQLDNTYLTHSEDLQLHDEEDSVPHDPEDLQRELQNYSSGYCILSQEIIPGGEEDLTEGKVIAELSVDLTSSSVINIYSPNMSDSFGGSVGLNEVPSIVIEESSPYQQVHHSHLDNAVPDTCYTIDFEEDNHNLYADSIIVRPDAPKKLSSVETKWNEDKYHVKKKKFCQDKEVTEQIVPSLSKGKLFMEQANAYPSYSSIYDDKLYEARRHSSFGIGDSDENACPAPSTNTKKCKTIIIKKRKPLTSLNSL